MENKKVFRSRISVLMLIFILAIFVPITMPMIKFMIIPGLWIMGITFLFVVFIFSGIRYVITDNYLSFNTWGTCKHDFPIWRIVSIKRSYNLLSSPAASLKRLCVDCSGADFPYLLVSPVREREFIETLKAINPNIRVDVTDKKGWWRNWDWDI